MHASLKSLLIILFISLLVACGGGGGNDNDSSSASGQGGSNPVDSDGDGMPDTYETEHGLNPQVDDGAGDLDGDGFTNRQEYDFETDPNDANSFPASVAITLAPEKTIYNDESLSLTASVSGAGNLTYQWSKISGAEVTFGTASAATTSVTFSPSMKTETFEFQLKASNEFSSDSKTISVTIKDRIDESVKSGDPSLLPAENSKLEQRIQDIVNIEETALVALHNQIFGSDEIHYDPGKSSRFFYLNSMNSAKEVVTGNKGKRFITAAEDNGFRRVALGDNIIVDLENGEHTAFANHMAKLVEWLIAPQGLNTGGGDQLKVGLMLMSSGNMTSTESWLQKHYSNASVSQCSDEAALSSCLAGMHLIITGSNNSMSEATVTAALNQAKQNKQSLLYTHNQYWNSTDLTNPILSYFSVYTDSPGSAGNYFSLDAANWSSASEMRAANNSLQKVSALASHFQKNDFR